MNFEFDNEMDAILRKSRGVSDFAAVSDHLDADEIAAFADNAVSEAARTRFTMHFADCARCRKILAISFATETEQPVAVAAVAPQRSESWFRALFRVPQLAFGLGAIVLAFAGFVGYIVIRNAGSGADMAATNREERRFEPATSAPANAPAGNADSTVTSNAPASNATAASSPNSPSNSAAKGPNGTVEPEQTPFPATNSAVASRDNPSDLDVTGGETTNDAKAVATPLPEPAKKPDASVVGGVPKTEQPRNDADRNLSYEDRKNRDEELGVTRSAPNAPKEKRDKKQTRALGGKTFNQSNGVWTDSEYRGQPTRTVRRSSDEYRKLDSGLRSITDQLPGTVVIVWKSTGYRIE